VIYGPFAFASVKDQNVNIGGKLLVLVFLLGTSLAHAQGAAKKDSTPPVPSAAFAPVQSAPAPPATETSSSSDTPSATPGPAPQAWGPAVTEPPAARPVAAPSNAVSDDENGSRHAGAHLHDGFYTRLGLGIGYISATTEHDSAINGWGVAPDVWIGGSPTPGLAIGVTFNGVSVPNPHAEISAADSGGLGPVSGEAHGTLTYSVFGLFADYYPAPARGLHFMAGLNYSVFQFAADNGQSSKPASGVGLFGGLGYEWWIGNEWSVGPLARLHWASVSDDGGSTSVLSPVLLLGFTYH
jgi:hypothetical protein